MKIGVLALQGAFAEHIVMLRRLGVAAAEVRLAAHLDALDGLIIPGGESTTIGKLATDFGLIEPLRRFGQDRAIWGTCAGAIFLARTVVGRAQPLLGLMDITVTRNAFGRQIDSFETDLDLSGFGEGMADQPPYHAVFIRAPLINAVGPAAQAIVTLPDGRIVAARQGRLLATSFHPELTDDTRCHAAFLTLAS
ncbi:MAG: pyridoxal 5'-phosphate synthase glutaminase subunit PdxT [Lentisphaerota bacterium]|jgi:5'-phosphate synthase pdxT subunit